MADLRVRELQACDLRNGFFETLDALRPTGDVDPAAAAAIFEQVRRNPDTVVAVAERDGRVVGTGTLYLLRKSCTAAAPPPTSRTWRWPRTGSARASGRR